MMRKNIIIAACLLGFVATTAKAQHERLDRGLVVAKGLTDGHYFASWRLLDTDSANVAFTLLRDGKPYKENIVGATSVEVDGTPTSLWQVVTGATLKNKEERIKNKEAVRREGNDENHNAQSSAPEAQCQPVLPWTQPYLKLKVTPPSGADGDATYTANDCSVGDVDGDGQYELIVKWTARDADNSQDGNTSNVFLSCYKLDMANPQNAPACLWTIDLGCAIRAGAHYTQFMVADFDGDGCAELMCKTAPGSKDGLGRYVNLASTDKDILAADNGRDWRNRRGRVSGGQEYLTVFSGADGHAISTVFYQPNRDTGVGGAARGTFNWNPGGSGKRLVDNAEYGNRGERYLACVAWLDGMDKSPCAIFTRGYYSYAFAWAVSFDGKQIHTKWLHESRDGKQYSVTDATGHKVTYTASAPTSGSGSATLFGNGNHNLCVADVDGDGCDEMVWGAATLDHDGRVLYATGFGHGDAVHLADLDPSRPGYEVFDVHENRGRYSWDVHDARTGEILFKGGPEGVDNGRGLTAQLSQTDSAYYFWSACAPELRSAATGEVASTQRASMNFRIFWDGDLQDELLDGTNIQKWADNGRTTLGIFGDVADNAASQAEVTDSPGENQPRPRRGGRRGRGFGFQRQSLSFRGYGNPTSNNWTKSNPCLQCDLFGDWREEVVYRDANDPTILYIYMSQIPTSHRMTTLMQDHLYRLGVAWQNVGYNQPPYKGSAK